MIQRAVTAIIGVVIGLFATFAVFSAILGGLDNFYLLTQDTCNYGSANSPKRVLRVAPENSDHPRNADEIDWTRDGLDLVHDGSGGCDVAGDFDEDLIYLTPTGDRIVLNTTGVVTVPVPTPAPGASGTPASITFLSTSTILANADRNDLVISTTTDVKAALWSDGNVAVYLPDREDDAVAPGSTGSTTMYIFNNNSDQVSETIQIDHLHYGNGVVFIASSTIWAISDENNQLHRFSTETPDTILETVNLNSGLTYSDLTLHEGNFYAMGHLGVYHFLNPVSQSAGSSSSLISIGTHVSSNTLHGMDIADDDSLIIYDPGGSKFIYAPDFMDASTGVVELVAENGEGYPNHGISIDSANSIWYTVLDGTDVVLYQSQYTAASGGGGGSGSGRSPGVVTGVDLTWIEAENVFTAQQQLVTLLAVIAAIGMPIGAMTAIVFFGQAVISSGVSGQGASQVLVAIAAVVVILVAVQMFQQFAGFLGTAFDAVNGDRFVVFDETLGSLAETIAEFWGVLAFAGLINIATIVWRNYSGNFSIGGTQGGL